MNLPSVKRMMDVLSIDKAKAKRIRDIMEGPGRTIRGCCIECDNHVKSELVAVHREKAGYLCSKHAWEVPTRNFKNWE